jgi:hypothetical protein
MNFVVDDSCALFAVRGGGEAHGKAEALPCGLEMMRTAKTRARQTTKPHGKHYRTAKPAQRTAKLTRTAKPLPCDFHATHGNYAFAV